MYSRWLRWSLFSAGVLLVLGVCVLAELQEAAVIHNHAQPTQTNDAHEPPGNPAANLSGQKHADKRDQKGHWYDHLTDWLLVLFNGILAIFTVRLFYNAAEQARDTKASIAVAKRAADAAKESAIALTQSERAHVFIRITGQNFVEVLSSAPLDGLDKRLTKAASIEFVFGNHGKTPAILKEMSRDIIIRPAFPEVVDYIPAELATTNRVIGASEATEPWRCYDSRATGVDANNVIRSHSYFWFYGRVLYDDVFGIEHEHRFIYRFGTSRGWQPFDHPEYSKNT
ncbi:MAG: hypothetical protein WAL80_21515 [Xanthobacteraceae bacterium]